MKYIIRRLLIVSLVFSTPYTYAEEAKDNGQCETAINCTVTQGDTTTTTTTPETTDGGTVLRRNSSGNTAVTTTTNSNYGSAGGADSGAYAAAEDAKNQANMVMIAAFATAAILAAMCNPTTNPTPCALAPLAALAGIMAMGKKDEAQRAMDGMGVSGTTDTTTDTTTDGTTDSTDGATQLASIQDTMSKKGYKMNSDGSMTYPNGTTVPADLNAASLQAAGFNGSQIGDIHRDFGKMKKDIADKAGGGTVVEEVSVASADGFGMGGGSKGGGNDREIASSSVAAERSDPDKDDPSKWAGYFKQFGDSQIGVAQSDIFLMVEKRVENERKVMGH